MVFKVRLVVQTSQKGARKVTVLLHFCTPSFFLLMILLVQNFMLIKNHIKAWVWKSTEMKLFTESSVIKTLPAHFFCNWKPGFLVVCLWFFINFNWTCSKISGIFGAIVNIGTVCYIINYNFNILKLGLTDGGLWVQEITSN